jgi:putative intracellular protease/amidase
MPTDTGCPRNAAMSRRGTQRGRRARRDVLKHVECLERHPISWQTSSWLSACYGAAGIGDRRAVACGAGHTVVVAEVSRRVITVVLFEGFELLDAFGPLEVFGVVPEGFSIRLAGPDAAPVHSAQGPAVVAVQQGPRVHWMRQARWVQDSNRWTSSGVAAGIDMAFALLAHLRDEDTATAASNAIEYERHRDPHWDPFAPDEPARLIDPLRATTRSTTASRRCRVGGTVAESPSG